jgi:hypothetical protein
VPSSCEDLGRPLSFSGQLPHALSGGATLLAAVLRTTQENPHSKSPQPGKTYLLFSLRLLHIVSSHLDAWGEDTSSEIRHIDPQEVGHLLGSWYFQSKEGRGKRFN